MVELTTCRAQNAISGFVVFFATAYLNFLAATFWDILGQRYRRDKTDRRNRKERSGRRHKCGSDKLGTRDKRRETGLKFTCGKRFFANIALTFTFP